MKKIDYDFFSSLVKPRPTGSSNNNEAILNLKQAASAMGYDTEQIPFDCVVWEKGESFLETDEEMIPIYTGPFSPPVEQSAEIIVIHCLDELKYCDIKDKIVVMEGEIAREPISPKNFPFYYPEEHKEINDLLEAKGPVAIIAVTGKHPMCGLDPCPMFEDGNFSVPSAYIGQREAGKLLNLKQGRILINSIVSDSKSSQLIIRKPSPNKSKGKIVLCAHIDTAYCTPGALDNASGVTVILQIMERLQKKATDFDFECIPFNGEDNFAVSGQRAYLDRYPLEEQDIKLVLNIDDAGHVGSKNALSWYCLDEQTESVVKAAVEEDNLTVAGPLWYESDHTMFVQHGIPSLVFASSDLLEKTVELTHTPNDNLDEVDYGLIENMSDFAVRLFQKLKIIE